MTSFELALPGRITFGPGAANGLARVVADLGARPLVVLGATPDRWAHLLDGLGAHEVVSVSGEPTVADARAAAAAGRSFAADVVVAIGGGSVIDLSKAAAMLLGNGGDPLDYLEVIGGGQPIRQPALPLVALPTTAGTGAEVTANAVLASPAHGLKASLRSPFMIPRHAIVDPELTLGCPPQVTAAAGMDAVTQCIEPYVSRKANPVTDAWARTGLLAAGRGLVRAHHDGSDVEARTDMALCSLMGGLALANAKLGAVHGIAGVIGGMAAAPHGAVCAALLGPVCRANMARASGRVLQRYSDVARWLTGSSTAVPADALVWIAEARLALSIPGLSAFGLGQDQAVEVAAKASRSSSMQGNPVPLSEAGLMDVFLAAL